MKVLNGFYLGKNECILRLVLAEMWQEFKIDYKNDNLSEDPHELSRLFQNTIESLGLFEEAYNGNKNKMYDPLEELDSLVNRINLSKNFAKLLEIYPAYKQIVVLSFQNKNNIMELSSDFNIEIRYSR